MYTIQKYPTSDSPPTDPFEGLVAVYFQLQGYITSSNKWFWVREKAKQQRGYQDIDVLALNSSETVIVSVTGNLDDKIRFTRTGDLRHDMLLKLLDYFDRVECFLTSVSKYSWMIKKPRSIRRVLAYISGPKRITKVSGILKKQDIELLQAQMILKFFHEEIPRFEREGLRTNNELIKLLQLITHNE